MKRRTLIPCACLLALLESGAWGQDTLTVRTTVPILVLPVSVTGKNGLPIFGLEKNSFEVLDRGVAQPFTLDAGVGSATPVALVVLIQTNDFANSALGKIRRVGSMISETITGEGGSSAVLSYDSTITLRQNFKERSGPLSAAFQTLHSSEDAEARLLDAVLEATRLLGERPSAERKSILILGQSRDRGSKAKLSTALEQLQHTGITIYALTYSAVLTAFTTRASEYQPPVNGSYLEGLRGLAQLGTADTVRSLVGQTGGLDLGFATKARLENELIAIGRDIHSRYVLAFTPSIPEPGFHRVTVTVKEKTNARVNTRQGYWPEGNSSATRAEEKD